MRQQGQGMKGLKHVYQLDGTQKVLGSGAYGKVVLSEAIHSAETQVAIKVLDKSKFNFKTSSVQDEVKCL